MITIPTDGVLGADISAIVNGMVIHGRWNEWVAPFGDVQLANVGKILVDRESITAYCFGEKPLVLEGVIYG